MNKTILLTFCLFISAFVHAQNYHLDLTTFEEKYIKEILNEVSQHKDQKEYAKAISGYNEIKKYLDTIPRLIPLKLILNAEKAKLFEKLNQYDSAATLYKDSKEIFNYIPGIIQDLPDIYVDIVIGGIQVDKKTEKYPQAIQELYNALLKVPGDQGKLRSKLYYHLGYTYWYIKDLEQAEKQFRTALSYSNISPFFKNSCYMGLGDALIKKDLDSSLYYYRKAEAYFANKTDKTNYQINQTNIANALILKDSLAKAEKILLNSKEYFENIKLTPYLIPVYTLLANINLNKPDLKSALYYLEMANPITLTKGSLRHREKFFEIYVEYSRTIRDSSTARHFNNQAKAVKDSIFNSEKLTQIEVYEVKHRNEINEIKIAAQNDLIASQIKQRNILLISLIVLGILIFILFLLYKQKLKFQKDLLNKKDELANQQLATLKETQKAERIQAKLDGQQQERSRIAKDLHDSIGGNLAAIKMQLTHLKSEEEQLNYIIKNVDTTYNELRMVSQNLFVQPADKPFTLSLEDLVDQYNSNKTIVELYLFPHNQINFISNTIQTELYPVLKEILTNIFKHAEANYCNINITVHEDYLNLIIEDDGVGFNPSKANLGLGLSNIKTRINTLNGEIQIESIPNTGTTININIPLAHA
ncbi:Signal transduction histidine kinase [Zhouia amylolytica]|uniref:Oxygen sensor histidine kinase NreB n=1 Tax=Zhouia amylolytica TaxID=376730 RepID=A0A1I6T2R4_9FLAO|nr:ATP-binding protein [Zhouia amylolytica]SFS83551.1 Signal transduction histidine kinase [Zhouia amylolytica]